MRFYLNDYEKPPEVPFWVWCDVLRGARLLADFLGPQWFKDVNPDKIRMCDPRSCLLSQIYGSFPKGCRALSIGMWGSAIHYGFTEGGWLFPRNYTQLEDAWLFLLKQMGES